MNWKAKFSSILTCINSDYYNIQNIRLNKKWIAKYIIGYGQIHSKFDDINEPTW